MRPAGFAVTVILAGVLVRVPEAGVAFSHRPPESVVAVTLNSSEPVPALVTVNWLLPGCEPVLLRANVKPEEATARRGGLATLIVS